MNELSYVKKKFIDYINNVIEYNKVSHAYLIEIDNENDMLFINNFIKMILCKKKYDEVIDADDKICNLIDKNDYPDITYISTDQSTIKKTTMIDLQKEFNNKSLYDNYKIYVIEEADKLNDSSSNTILKFLEEPEENIIAFLITISRYHVLETILSRCQVLSLKENEYDIDLNDDVLDFINYILYPEEFFINYNNIIKNIYSDKNKLKSVLSDCELLIINYLNKTNNNHNIVDLFSNFKSNKLIMIVSIIEDELPKLKYNVNYKIWVDSLFARLLGGVKDD